MSALVNFSINVAKLPKEKFVQGKNGNVYYNFTVSLNDETNQWGQNASAWDSQTKEERDAKKNRDFIGNGKVVWTDGNCVTAERVEKEDTAASQPKQDEVEDLPF